MPMFMEKLGAYFLSHVYPKAACLRSLLLGLVLCCIPFFLFLFETKIVFTCISFKHIPNLIVLLFLLRLLLCLVVIWDYFFAMA